MENLLAHQQEVIDEKNQLEEKTEKLQEFIIYSPDFKLLSDGEKERIKRQVEVMRVYRDLLEDRIANFPMLPEK